MSFKCELVELTSRPALTIRTRITAQEIPQVFGDGFYEIGKYLEEVKAPLPDTAFAIYYNMDMQDLDIEFGVPLSQSLNGKDQIQASETPGGKSASCIHIGPYSEVEAAYNALFKWIKDNGYEPAGVAYEIYLNDPQETPPEKLETRIHLLLKDA